MELVELKSIPYGYRGMILKVSVQISYLYNVICTDPNFPISMSNNKECKLEKMPP